MKPDCNLFEKELNFKVSFPFTVHPETVQKLLKQDIATVNHMMYM